MPNSIRFLRSFFPIKVNAPIYLLFFVTSQCMGKCRHCFYWQELNRKENPLNLDEIEKICQNLNPLLLLTITGGEPLLREDLVEIFKLFYRYNKPFSLGLATSGFYPEKLEKVVKEVLETTGKTNFGVALPIEGPKELNDQIRGINGFFEKTQESIMILKNLKKHFPKLSILVDLTISHFNQDHLVETYHLVKEQFAPDLINLIITRGEPKEPIAKQIAPEKIQAVFELLEKDITQGKMPGFSFFTKILHSKDIILRRIALEIFQGKKPRFKCQAGRLIGVIYPEGEVYPCELWEKPIGDLRAANYDFKKIWNSKPGEEARSQIREKHCLCYHQCFLSPSLFFDLFYLPYLLKESLTIKKRK